MTETEQLNERYLVERFLGRGGMGEVFAGRALGLEGFSRRVAIKRIPPLYSDDPAHRSMLVTEARLAARLSHGNVVAVHDLAADEGGRLFLVMELVDGIDLATLLLTGALPLPVALFITCEILRGLGHAHELPASDDLVRGLVHRDVSPQNMLIGWDGAVKVSDFGLAKARANAEASASFLARGKLGYMSPEQANNAALDGRSDLFSVGVMLWEMICGTRLFGRSSLDAAATARSARSAPIPPPRSRLPGLPEEIERITMRLLERDRSRRYATAGAAIEALVACAPYPRNGRELLSALLSERLQGRTRPRSGGGERLLSADEETTVAPPIAPLPVPVEPYPDPPPPGRARRSVSLALLVVATALVTMLAVGAGPRLGGAGDPDVPAARGAPPVEPQGSPQPPSEPRGITPTPPPAPAALVTPAPALAPQARPTSAPIGRVPARGRQAPPAPDPEPAGRQGIHMLDLRELAPRPDEPRTGGSR
jgi:serine/threonine protein kinase